MFQHSLGKYYLHFVVGEQVMPPVNLRQDYRVVEDLYMRHRVDAGAHPCPLKSCGGWPLYL